MILLIVIVEFSKQRSRIYNSIYGIILHYSLLFTFTKKTDFIRTVTHDLFIHITIYYYKFQYQNNTTKICISRKISNFFDIIALAIHGPQTLSLCIFIFINLYIYYIIVYLFNRFVIESDLCFIPYLLINERNFNRLLILPSHQKKSHTFLYTYKKYLYIIYFFIILFIIICSH